MLVSESTKRLTVLVKKSRRGVQQPDVMGRQKRMRSLAVRASSSRIETVIKGLQNLLHLSENADTTDYVSVEGVLTVRKRSVLNWMDINSDIVDDAEDSLLDRKVLLQLVSSDQVDPGTKIGKLGKECEVLNWNLVQDSLISEDVTYPVTLLVPKDFGTPGAFIVRNKHMNEFFLKSLSLTLPDNSSGNKTQVFFPCNSWVYNEKKYQCNRIFFSNQAFLTNQTPPGLVQLRETEMMNLRGDGLGERQVWDRIYDYAIYNDLGDPTKPEDKRPNLGGSKEFPYPRRCRTGRPVYDVDPTMERRVLRNFYIPRDEIFDGVKQSDFLVDQLTSAAHNLVPAIEQLLSGGNNEFRSFKEVRNLYEEGLHLAEQLQQVKDTKDQTQKMDPFQVVKNLGADDRQDVLKFTIPQVISYNEEGWKEDEEFARQRIAGNNPILIKLLTSFPIVSELNDPEGRYGDPTSAITHSHIEPYLEGMSVEQALEAKKLYVLDYHDLYLPVVKQINELESFDSQTYATRSIFFLNKNNVLKPCAIELALEDSTGRGKRVFTPPKNNQRDWMWDLAKAHVCTNDAGVHQLYSHWTRTHASVEPFIIATNRQLSVMHPLNILLQPHFKNTMNINARARLLLISVNGVIEKCFTPGKFAMQISSLLYGALWRFDEQGLPNDLLKRGMAVKDATSESGVKLQFEDYPYARDGLDLWCAFKSWVTDYINVYYASDKIVQQDMELQEWWSEIRTKGHADKKDAPGWPSLNSKANLVEILTTIIWISSAHHAAVNFGQYAYIGYMPNVPVIMRRLVPEVGTKEHSQLLSSPEQFFLQSHGRPWQTTVVMAIVEILSKHAQDEEYIGESFIEGWTDNKQVLDAFQKFDEKLQKAGEAIKERNATTERFPNRWGPTKVPYTLLYPKSDKPGLTGMGVPNSISI
ncbi:unnamed protein product [Sphagnum jensenii]|uniref:Lipoxygenase n=1 Tax=Sphagnum jensenii TaxID=128206 RepID=A0ABP1BHV7_9BRYO